MPSSRQTTRVLSSLKTSPLGASQLASRALTSSASGLEWQRATRSSAYLTSTGEEARHRQTGVGAGRLVADPGGLLHPVQGDVQQHGADHRALRSSLPGARPTTFLDHPRLQPLLDHFPGGERAKLTEDVGMVDLVERPGQIRI